MKTPDPYDAMVTRVRKILKEAVPRDGNNLFPDHFLVDKSDFKRLKDLLQATAADSALREAESNVVEDAMQRYESGELRSMEGLQALCHVLFVERCVKEREQR